MVAALEGRVSEGAALRVPKTAELVAAHIRRRIIRGELRPGEALSGETVLTGQFGISRPTLREAFRILESEALIQVRRGVHGGARVAAPDSAVAARYVSHILQYEAVSLADVHEARTALEAPAVARLASRADHVAHDPQLVLNEDLSRAVEIHAGFQRLVVELAGNRTVALLSRMLESVFAEAAGQYVREHETALTQQKRRRADRAHHRLVELVRAGDAAGAEELWRRHLTEIGRILSRGTRAGATLEILR